MAPRRHYSFLSLMTTMAYFAKLRNTPGKTRFVLICASLIHVLAFAVTLGPTEVRAAGVPANFEPAFSVCATPVPSNEEKLLRADQKKYESLVAPLLSKQRNLNDPVSAQSKSIDATLRPIQVKLLRVLERLECVRLKGLSDPLAIGPNGVPVRGSSGVEPNFVELRINYVTDRLKESDPVKVARNDPNEYFSGTLDADFKDFSFGKVAVTIPTQRQPGELNLPSAWSFVGEPDSSRYFVIRSVEEGTRLALFNELNESGANNDSTLLLFVHGFNVSFSEAAMRTAQLAHDLQFPGKVMLYSWPSAGKVSEYWQDEESARISTPRFRKFLADVLKTKITRVFIVAHSMGTRIVIPALPTLAEQGADVSKVSELMLAAADFNVIEFKELAADFAKLREQGTRLTIYSASNDFALQTSRWIHSYRRLGESDPSLIIFKGLDSVDASVASTFRRAFGHSYVSDSSQVISDMQHVVLRALAPPARGLLPIPDTINHGWKLPKVQ